MSTPPPPRLIITGIGGYGGVHLENAKRLAESGRLRIVAVVDPAIAGPTHEGIPLHASLDEALAAHEADVVVVATPLHTHAALCETAMRAGADVLLEKPPVPTMAEYTRLLEVQRETGRAVQVGFQSLGSAATAALADGGLGLGAMRAVSACGLWSRPLAYWARAGWAGSRSIDGHWVVDGVATNPLAHAVATALRIAGFDTAESVGRVETDLYRANAIDADDTSVIRVSGPGRPTVTCALTLCAPPIRGTGAPHPDSPAEGAIVTVQGEEGAARFSYTTDVVTIDGAATGFDRTDLLENLLDHRSDGTPLIVPLTSTGAFMRVVEAIRLAPAPTRVDPEAITWHEVDGDSYPVIDGVADTVVAAASTGSTFAEVHAPWARDAHDGVVAEATVAGRAVAVELDGTGTIPSSSPHPYLHPVRTCGGVTVTAAHPADHDWHVGVSLSVPDAGGANFWGGRSYVRDEGYRSLDDHGSIAVVSTTRHDDGVEHTLVWRDRDGTAVLEENRRIAWSPLPESAGAQGWMLGFRSRLTPVGGAVLLSGPGPKGRSGAGYGGFFWRFPRCVDVHTFTEDAEGEAELNGSVAPWLAWTARFDADPDHAGDASIVLTPAGDETARDPWFVRVTDYPGVGSALAWDSPLPVPADGVDRAFRVAVLDGRITAPAAARVAEALGEEVTR